MKFFFHINTHAGFILSIEYFPDCIKEKRSSDLSRAPSRNGIFKMAPRVEKVREPLVAQITKFFKMGSNLERIILKLNAFVLFRIFEAASRSFCGGD